MNTDQRSKAKSLLDRARAAQQNMEVHLAFLSTKHSSLAALESEISRLADSESEKRARLGTRVEEIKVEIKDIESSASYQSDLMTIREAAAFLPQACLQASGATVTRFAEHIKELEPDLEAAKELVRSSRAFKAFQEDIHKPLVISEEDPCGSVTESIAWLDWLLGNETAAAIASVFP